MLSYIETKFSIISVSASALIGILYLTLVGEI